MIEQFKLFSIYLFSLIITLTLKSYSNLYFNNSLLENLLSQFIFINILFIFSISYNNPSVIDLGWATVGILLIISNIINGRINYSQIFSNLNIQEIIVILGGLSLILIYSIRHNMLYLKNFKGFQKENMDFRYKEYEEKEIFKNFKVGFLIFNYLCLHIFPHIWLTLTYQPVFDSIEYIMNKNSINNFYFTTLSCILSFSAILLETIADNQLKHFKIKRKMKETYTNVINNGLWKYCRHPNYLGEILFYISLFLMNFFVTNLVGKNLLGLISLIFLFIFYSIPVMEKKLTQQYKEEYIKYKNSVFCLIPYLI